MLFADGQHQLPNHAYNAYCGIFTVSRTVDIALGRPLNTFVITARECTRALREFELQESRSWRTRTKVLWEYVQMEVRLLLFRIATAFVQLDGSTGQGLKAA